MLAFGLDALNAGRRAAAAANQGMKRSARRLRVTTATTVSRRCGCAIGWKHKGASWKREPGVPLPRPRRRPARWAKIYLITSYGVRDITDRLLAGVPAEETERTAEQQARWLLAQLLEWHRLKTSRRIGSISVCATSTIKSCRKTRADGRAGLRRCREKVKKSLIHRYRFPLRTMRLTRARDRARSANGR